MNQMLRSKTVPVPLPLISLAVVVLLRAIIFSPLISSGGTAIGFALYCALFCWLCSVACGLYGVKRSSTAFPKLEKASFVLLGLSALSFVALWALLDPALDGVVRKVMGVVCLSGLLWCFLSLLITIVVIFRDARNFSTWIIFITQILWVTSSLHFYHLAIAIGDSC